MLEHHFYHTIGQPSTRILCCALFVVNFQNSLCLTYWACIQRKTNARFLHDFVLFNKWVIYLGFISDKIIDTLGEGTFGKVVEVKDLEM